MFTERGQKLALRRLLESCVCQIHQKKVKPVWDKTAALWKVMLQPSGHLANLPPAVNLNYSLSWDACRHERASLSKPRRTQCRVDSTSYLWHPMFILRRRGRTRTHAHVYTHADEHLHTRTNSRGVLSQQYQALNSSCPSSHFGCLCGTTEDEDN